MSSVAPLTPGEPSMKTMNSKSITSNGEETKSKPSASRLFWEKNLREFSQSASVTGVQYVGSPEEPLFRRVLWSVLILSGAVFMLYQVINQISQYTKKEAQTEMREVFPPSIPFPAVTLCPENRVVRSKARDAGILAMIEDFNPPYRDPNTRFPNLTKYNMTSLSSNWSQTYIDTSNTLDEVFHMCFFKGRCNSSWFKTVYTPSGICFQMDTARLAMTVERPGATYGLVMMLYANHTENSVLLAFSSGFRLMVHEPDELPDISTSVLVNPGDISHFQIEKRQLIQTPEVCSGPENRKLEYFQHYSKRNCEAECDSKLIQSACGCRQFGLPGPDSLPVCDPVQASTCADVVLFISPAAQDCDCPEECDVTRYRV